MFSEKDTYRRYVSVEISSREARGNLAINIIIYETRCRTCPGVNLFFYRGDPGGVALDDHQRHANPSIRLSVTCQRSRVCLISLWDVQWRHGWRTRKLNRNANRGAERLAVMPCSEQTTATRASACTHARPHASSISTYIKKAKGAGGNELKITITGEQDREMNRSFNVG